MKSLPVFLFLASPLVAQSNGSPVDEGRFLYRGNCAFCHGLTAAGGRGPALAHGNFQHGSTAEDIARVIRNGIPGTNMPAFQMEKEEIDNLVQFLHSLSGGNARREPVAGDRDKGREVYNRGGCAGCHRIGNEGSIFGPDLTRIGAARSPEYIRDSVLHPSADIPEDFEAVTVVTRDGRRITGLRVNEDTFSVQLRDQSQHFRMFQKSDAREVIHEKNSLMPAYASLGSTDLQNLLAYLDSLRGDIKTGADVRKAEGIR
jgi:cytochrome c oxidase cbb3-type subunit III